MKKRQLKKIYVFNENGGFRAKVCYHKRKRSEYYNSQL